MPPNAGRSRPSCSSIQPALLEQLSDALAAVDIADDHLDDFARRFQYVVLTLVGHDKKAELCTHYFKKSLAELAALNNSIEEQQKKALELEAEIDGEEE